MGFSTMWARCFVTKMAVIKNGAKSTLVYFDKKSTFPLGIFKKFNRLYMENCNETLQ